VDRLLATKREGVGLIVRAISFQDFQPTVYVITIHQRYRQTDRRHAIPRPRICTKVHCVVKKRRVKVHVGLGMPKGGMPNGKNDRQDRAKVTTNCLHSHIYEVLISAKRMTLNMGIARNLFWGYKGFWGLGGI